MSAIFYFDQVDRDEEYSKYQLCLQYSILIKWIEMKNIVNISYVCNI